MLSRIALSVSTSFFKAAGSAQSRSDSNISAASKRKSSYARSEGALLMISIKRLLATREVDASVAKDCASCQRACYFQHFHISKIHDLPGPETGQRRSPRSDRRFAYLS